MLLVKTSRQWQKIFSEETYKFSGISLVNAMYLEGGVRGVEMGSVMFGKRNPETGAETPVPFELVRLTFPRRVYTQSHFDYVIEVLKRVWENRENLPLYKISQEPPFLRHFSAHLTPH